MKEKKMNMYIVIRFFFLSLFFNVWLKKNLNFYYSVLCIINIVCVLYILWKLDGENIFIFFFGKNRLNNDL